MKKLFVMTILLGTMIFALAGCSNPLDLGENPLKSIENGSESKNPMEKGDIEILESYDCYNEVTHKVEATLIVKNNSSTTDYHGVSIEARMYDSKGKTINRDESVIAWMPAGETRAALVFLDEKDSDDVKNEKYEVKYQIKKGEQVQIPKPFKAKDFDITYKIMDGEDPNLDIARVSSIGSEKNYVLVGYIENKTKETVNQVDVTVILKKSGQIVDAHTSFPIQQLKPGGKEPFDAKLVYPKEVWDQIDEIEFYPAGEYYNFDKK